jgi:hypothetical protein
VHNEDVCLAHQLTKHGRRDERRRSEGWVEAYIFVVHGLILFLAGTLVGGLAPLLFLVVQCKL